MDATKLLEKYVSLPSGSGDIADVTALANEIGRDLAALGLSVSLRGEKGASPIVAGEYGRGAQKLLLIGHMDTVFPRAEFKPFRIEGARAYGSGAMDMKGGLVVMHEALARALPAVDADKYTIKVAINSDEEIGSPSSHEFIYDCAVGAKACLSFEPCRPGGGLVCERKGVTAFTLKCTGVRGHAGAAYLKCHSAIQELCARVTRLYALRDDARDISINIGAISGGTADNIVADCAEARGEFRYFDMAYRAEMMKAIERICAAPGVEGCATRVAFGATHPSAKFTPESRRLFETARAVAQKLGFSVYAESTGGAGDMAIAALAGAPVLDGLGLEGVGAHTRDEYACLDKFPQDIALAEGLLRELTK